MSRTFPFNSPELEMLSLKRNDSDGTPLRYTLEEIITVNCNNECFAYRVFGRFTTRNCIVKNLAFRMKLNPNDFKDFDRDGKLTDDCSFSAKYKDGRVFRFSTSGFKEIDLMFKLVNQINDNDEMKQLFKYINTLMDSDYGPKDLTYIVRLNIITLNEYMMKQIESLNSEVELLRNEISLLKEKYE
jgi:hypothetical protein